MDIQSIPHEFQNDIRIAVDILQNLGVKEIYLFGSVASGKTDSSSDIDLAIRGLPGSLFFTAYGKLLMSLDHQVDLVDLDDKTEFNDYILNNTEILRVA